MEKRRRARINQCLDELKSLILEAMKKDVSTEKLTDCRALLSVSLSPWRVDNSDFARDRSRSEQRSMSGVDTGAFSRGAV